MCTWGQDNDRCPVCSVPYQSGKRPFELKGLPEAMGVFRQSDGPSSPESPHVNVVLDDSGNEFEDLPTSGKVGSDQS